MLPCFRFLCSTSFIWKYGENKFYSFLFMVASASVSCFGPLGLGNLGLSVNLPVKLWFLFFGGVMLMEILLI